MIGQRNRNWSRKRSSVKYLQGVVGKMFFSCRIDVDNWQHWNLFSTDAHFRKVQIASSFHVLIELKPSSVQLIATPVNRPQPLDSRLVWESSQNCRTIWCLKQIDIIYSAFLDTIETSFDSSHKWKVVHWFVHFSSLAGESWATHQRSGQWHKKQLQKDSYEPTNQPTNQPTWLIIYWLGPVVFDIFVLYSPLFFWWMDPIELAHIFQMGWFNLNHQLETVETTNDYSHTKRIWTNQPIFWNITSVLGNFFSP